MAEGFWTLFCDCSTKSGSDCSSNIAAIIDPDSCINNIVVVAVDILLLFVLFCIFIYRTLSKKVIASSQSYALSNVSIVSATFNACLGLAYLGSAIWKTVEKVNTDQSFLPLHGWIVFFFQGFSWLVLGLTINLKKPHTSQIAISKLLSIFGFFIAVFLCGSSIWEAVLNEAVIVLNILCFPGSVLLLCSAFEGSNVAKDDAQDDALATPLLRTKSDIAGNITSNENVTPFAKAGLFSIMSFWWLNPLMKKGRGKILENEDIPHLRQVDQARTLYLMFREQMHKRKESGSCDDDPSILSTIFFCQRKPIIISGIFALIKVLTLTSGPLFLMAFISVVEGETAFEGEGYALTAGLFVVKVLESLSERQWFFRTRLIGLQVRSLISAAIYQKQLRLSTAAKMSHSPGEIVNYVSVDAYKVGDFPYWFHQIWSTSLQLCLSLIIVYFSVGIATLAALITLILIALASSPLVKMQHLYQTKFMATQNKRLKAITEALSNMKILKLYSWETNFKKVIEGLRAEEFKWINKVLLRRGYFITLFWSSPILVSAVTFWTCYFLGFTLTASNGFTFLATLRIVQEPIRLIPDIFGSFIEARVSFSRIVKFLDAQELENKDTRKESTGIEAEHSIFIRASEI